MSALKLTEADLDAAIAARTAAPPVDADIPQLWDEERESPWLLALYALGLVAAIGVSAFASMGFRS